METLYAAATAAVQTWAQTVCGAAVCLRPSRYAMLAASDFVRGGAKEAANRLSERIDSCTLHGAPLVARVWEQNGWLLFDLDRRAFDAYACSLPESFPHGTAYLDRRMEMLLRHGDAPLPDCPAVLWAVWTASYASMRKNWTQDAERAVLTMTHGLSGMERVQTEHSAARAAKIILYERRNLV